MYTVVFFIELSCFNYFLSVKAILGAAPASGLGSICLVAVGKLLHAAQQKEYKNREGIRLHPEHAQNYITERIAKQKEGIKTFHEKYPACSRFVNFDTGAEMSLSDYNKALYYLSHCCAHVRRYELSGLDAKEISGTNYYSKINSLYENNETAKGFEEDIEYTKYRLPVVEKFTKIRLAECEELLSLNLKEDDILQSHAAGARGGNQRMSRTKGCSIRNCMWPWIRLVCRSEILLQKVPLQIAHMLATYSAD